MGTRKSKLPLEEYQSTNIRLEDGRYKWTYEMNMFTNPSLFFTVFKVFVLIVFIVWLILAPFIMYSDGLDGLWGHTCTSILVLGIFLVLGLVSYFIIAALYGGRYKVEFELDRDYLVHRQVKSQAEKARKLGVVAMIMGLFARKPSVIATGSVAAGHNVSTSPLANVSVIRGRRWRNTIHVNQLFNRNQVYVAREDYDFVFNFLRENCPKAKIR